MMQWLKMDSAPLDGTSVLLFTTSHGICEARFDQGYWTESTPLGPAEYTGSAWVCCDDAFQIEVDEDHDVRNWSHGSATHWARIERPDHTQEDE